MLVGCAPFVKESEWEGGGRKGREEGKEGREGGPEGEMEGDAPRITREAEKRALNHNIIT